MSKVNIPVIIKNWIEKLNDPKEKDFVRENYRMMMENLIDILSAEVARYRRKRM